MLELHTDNGATGSDDMTSAGDSPMCTAEQPMAGGYHLVYVRYMSGLRAWGAA